MNRISIEMASLKMGIAGAFLVAGLFFCVGSMGALGVSLLQLIVFFLAGAIVPVVLGAVAGIGVSSFGRTYKRISAFLLGALSMLIGLGVVIYTADFIGGLQTHTRILLAYLIPLMAGLAVELLVHGGVNKPMVKLRGFCLDKSI